MIEYPYMISNNKIPQIFEKIKSAAVPETFSHTFLKNLGFSSSNDRAFIPLAKRLGLLSQDGTPTEYYVQLKNPSDFGVIIASRIKDLYSELFSINTEINKASDQDIRGAIARVTGKDATTVGRYTATFKTLLPLGDFQKSNTSIEIQPVKTDERSSTDSFKSPKQPVMRQEIVDFHYNIQIHLPATTDINIYNAIFKSIKENLIDE